MKLHRRKIRSNLRLDVDVYRLISRAVENGIEVGLRRAHKHTETPDKETIKWQIENEIMNELSEIFIWPSREG